MEGSLGRVMFERHLASVIESLLDEFRVIYLTGPRQSGKTTVVRQIAKQCGLVYLTLDDGSILDAASLDPHGLIESFEGQNLALDEFQYTPALIPAIKAESDRLGREGMGKFLLTGSADIFRSAHTQEALPGHMARFELYPLSAMELGGQRSNIIDLLSEQSFVKKAVPLVSKAQLAGLVLAGGYPEIQNKSPRAKKIWFQSYVEGRLLKDFDVLYRARGDYHAKVKALVHYLAGLTGNLLKYANVSKDLEIDDKLAKSYIQILELMFIVKRLPGYLKNKSKRQATRMPKLHFVDTGLACHLLGLTSTAQLMRSQYYGGLVENFVLMEFCKHVQWADNDIELWHFRDKHMNEVDIVMEQTDGSVIGVEVKASATVGVADFKGLRKLADFTGQRFYYGVVFYNGEHVLPFHQDNRHYWALPMGLLTGQIVQEGG